MAPHLTPKHKADRLAFALRTAKDLLPNNPELLERLIFVDGAIFSKKHASSFEPDKIKIVVPRGRKFPRPSFSQLPRSKSFEIYLAITANDQTNPMPLRTADSTRDVRPTCDILEYFISNEIVPMADRMRGNLGLDPTTPLYIIWDHAAVHRAGRIISLLEEHHLEVFGLPARCPELNVIEVLWHLDKTALRSITFANNSYDAFLAAVQEACSSISQETINNLVFSFPARCAAMIKAKGGAHRYEGEDYAYAYDDDIEDDEDQDE